MKMVVSFAGACCPLSPHVIASPVVVHITPPLVLLHLSSFSRLIPGVDPAPQDKNLNRSYYFLFASDDQGRCRQ